MRLSLLYRLFCLSLLFQLGLFFPVLEAKEKKKDTKSEDPYSEFVWPPPPDEARIKLQEVITGRSDVEAGPSRMKKILIGGAPQSPYDTLSKPFAVAFDAAGRILVTDSGSSSLVRFDLAGRRMDVLGTQGRIRLKLPLGLTIAPDETIFVADSKLQQVVAFDPEGTVVGVYGKQGDLVNPTDAALSPDQRRLYVADSKAHTIVVFDITAGDIVSTIGRPGEDAGEFAFPTSLAFGPENRLFVVDQINSRVQVFSETGEFEDAFGALGTGFGSFVRPKDVVVDQEGLIYVTDNAFNNFQVFDSDFTLLTFVGEMGTGPGRFHGVSGIDVVGDRIAVVDQLGKRVQVFEYIASRTGE